MRSVAVYALIAFTPLAALAGLILCLGGPVPPPPPPPPDPPPRAVLTATALWEKVRPEVMKANIAADAALSRRTAEIEQFLTDRAARGGRPFAEAVLGSPWTAARLKISGGDAELSRWIDGLFAAHLFTPADLGRVVSGAAKAYLDDISAIDNALATAVYTLAKAELDQPPEINFPGIQPERGLGELNALTDKAVAAVLYHLKVAAGQEVVSLLASELGARLAVHVLRGAAVRLGLAGAVGGIAANSSLETAAVLVVGLGVGYIVDVLIDIARRNLLGYDPEGELAEEVRRRLVTVGKEVVDGSATEGGLRRNLSRVNLLRAVGRGAMAYRMVWGAETPSPLPAPLPTPSAPVLGRRTTDATEAVLAVRSLLEFGRAVLGPAIVDAVSGVVRLLWPAEASRRYSLWWVVPAAEVGGQGRWQIVRLDREGGAS